MYPQPYSPMLPELSFDIVLPRPGDIFVLNNTEISDYLCQKQARFKYLVRFAIFDGSARIRQQIEALAGAPDDMFSPGYQLRPGLVELSDSKSFSLVVFEDGEGILNPVGYLTVNYSFNRISDMDAYNGDLTELEEIRKYMLYIHPDFAFIDCGFRFQRYSTALASQLSCFVRDGIFSISRQATQQGQSILLDLSMYYEYRSFADGAVGERFVDAMSTFCDAWPEMGEKGIERIEFNPDGGF